MYNFVSYSLTPYQVNQYDVNDDSIKIGILHSRTGDMQISEESLVHAALLAVSEINSKGGIHGRKIKPVVLDGESDVDTFKRRAQDLIEIHNVSSIFGCWTSDSRKAVKSIVEEHNNLLWYPVQYEGGETSTNVVYTGAAPNQQIEPAVDWSINYLNSKQVDSNFRPLKVFLVGSDYIFPREANRIIKTKISDSNAIVIGEEYITRGSKAFEEIAEMIVIEKPDLIFNTVNGDSNVAFFEHLAKNWPRNTQVPLIMSFSIAEDEIRSMGERLKTREGARLLVGSFCAWNYYQSLKTAENIIFVDNFQTYCEKNNLPGGRTRVTDDPIEVAYSQIHLFAKALEKSKSTNPQIIKAALAGLEFNGPGGRLRIDPKNQHAWKSFRVGKINPDGQFDIIFSSNDQIPPDPYTRIAFKNGLVDARQRNQLIDKLLEMDQVESLTTTTILSALKSKYPDIRQLAVEKIVLRENEYNRLLAHLDNSLEDQDLSVAQSALESISKAAIYNEDVLRIVDSKLRSERVGIRKRALQILVGLTQQSINDNSSRMLPQLQDAYQLLARDLYPKTQHRQIAIIDGHIKQLIRIRNNSTLYKIRRALFNSIWFWIVVAYLGIILFIWGVGLRFFPLWILRVNNALTSFTEIKIADYTIPLSLNHVIGLGWFHYHPRVLDAWVLKQIPTVRHNFHNYETIRRRNIYIPVPVSINGKVQDNFTQQDFINISRAKRWCIHIKGPGGTGKTALASQIALWSIEAQALITVRKSFCKIPILIEPGLGTDIIKDNESLESIVLGQLCLIVATGEKIPLEFCRELMRKQRLLLIIDDLSLLAPPGWALPQDANFTANALIVTSRIEEKMGNALKYDIVPLAVTGKQLSSFLESYLQKRGYRNEFTDPEFFQSCNKLSLMIGQSKKIDSKNQLTVLFVKIYAEQIIGIKRDHLQRDIPQDIPNLMLQYLDELNRLYVEWDIRHIHTAAKIVAWHCCREELYSSTCKRSDLITELGNNGEALLNHLLNKLVIIQTAGVDRNSIRFTIDPLAEYLAAFYLIEHCGSDLARWDDFFSTITCKTGINNESFGFLSALRECCLVSGHPKVSVDMYKRLSLLLGLDDTSIGTIKIGLLHSLTGHMEISERPLVDAALLAVNEINLSGGILGMPIQTLIENGASNKLEFAAKAKYLIEKEKVCAIFGCWTSDCRKAVMPIVENLDNLLWYPIQYEGFESSSNIIYTGASPNQQIIPAIEWCIRNVGSKIFLVGSDYEFPRKANQIVNMYLSKYDIKPVGEEYLNLGNRDFSQIVSKIKNAKPDIVFNTVNGESNRGLFTELDKQGLTSTNCPVMSVSLAEVEVAEIGTALMKGHYAAWTYFQSIDTPENNHFVSSYKQFKGANKLTDDPIETAYYQIHMFALAVVKAGTIESRAIREAARGLAYSAPSGLVKIDPDNLHAWRTARIGKVTNDGQFEILYQSAESIKPDPYLEQIGLPGQLQS